MEIDKLAGRLVALAAKQNLSKAEHGQAQMLMRQIKEAGMSNEEISKLSKGRWSPSSVKGYVTGVRAADPSQWGDAASILNEAINKGISMDEIQSAVGIREHLASEGVTIEEVAALLDEAKSHGVDVKALIEQHENFKSDRLSTKDVKQVLDLKRELEERGLNLQSLPDVVKLAKNFGDVQAVLEAISKYRTLQEVEEELTKAEERCQSVRNELASETKHLAEAKAKSFQLKQPLEAYGNAVKLGFSEGELGELANLAKKYGGVKKVFGAIKAYGELSDILGEITRARATHAEMKTKIAKTDQQYAHLKTSVDMCDRLIRDYKCGFDAIATIFSTAQKLGDSINVLRAIEAYGRLQTLQAEVATLEARAAEQKRLLLEAQGKYQQALSDLDSLYAQVLKTGQDVGRVQKAFEHGKDTERILNILHQPSSASYEEHGQMALVITVALKSWVIAHQHRFKSAGSIKSGLDLLIKELGGP